MSADHHWTNLTPRVVLDQKLGDHTMVYASVARGYNAGGYDAELGARPMRRAIGRLVEAPIAEMVLRGELEKGDVAVVTGKAGRVKVSAIREGKTRASA